jgi:hypothetical protein
VGVFKGGLSKGDKAMTVAGSTKVWFLQVSWVTCDAQTGPEVAGPQPKPISTSLSYWKTRDCQAKNKHCRSKRAVGVTTSYFSNYTASAPETTYASGIIHHVLLQGEAPHNSEACVNQSCFICSNGYDDEEFISHSPSITWFDITGVKPIAQTTCEYAIHRVRFLA